MKIGNYSVPFLSLFLFFALGIVFTEYYPDTVNVWSLGVVFAILITVGFVLQNRFHQLKSLFKLILSLALFALGCFVYSFHDNSRHELFYDVKEKADYSIITLKKQVGSSNKYNKYYGDLSLVKQDGIYRKKHGGVLVYLPKADSTKYLYGDKVLFKGSVSVLPHKRNPYEFDYKRFLNRSDIDFQIKGNSTAYKRIEEGTGMLHLIDSYRKRLSRKLDFYMGEEEAGVAKALILGYKDDLSPDTIDAFKNTGSMHVLAVSGLHLGILFVFVGSLFRMKLLSRIPVFLQFAVIVGALWFYVFLSGMSISVLRAAIMFSVIQLGVLLNRKGNVINSLFLSAFVVLLLFPKELFQVGFQLSYLAVLGIVLLHKYIDNWMEFPDKTFNYLWSIIAVSISAQLSIGILSMYYFHSFPLLFPASNIVVIVLSGFELALGFSFVFLSEIETLAKPIAFCLDFLIAIKLRALSALGAVPNALMKSIYLTGVELVLYYLMLLCLIYYLLTRKVRSLYMGLMSLVFVGVFYVWSSYTVSRQSKIVLFGTNDICLAYLEGNKAYVYTSKKGNKKALSFYAEPYLRYNGIRDMIPLKEGTAFTCSGASISGEGLIRMKDQFYAHYTGDLVLDLSPVTLFVTKSKAGKFLRNESGNYKRVLLLTNSKYEKFESSDHFMTIHDFNGT